MCRTAPLLLLVLQVVWLGAAGQRTFDQSGRGIEFYFKDCRVGSSGFDSCVKDGLNAARIFFKTGLPEYGVLPFDPFFAAEVTQKRGRRLASYMLRLSDVYEHGWTQSLVTSFKSDLPSRTIKYSQWFPEKYLEGRYEMDGKVLRYPLNNKGFFNLTLYNYTQSTIIRRPETGPMTVRISARTATNMKVHVSNLLRGRPVMEDLLDRIINFSWAPGFEVLKPAIDDLVSTAFSAIFNKDFESFPFQRVFPT